MTFALISIIGFMVRGILAIKQHAIMRNKWLRILPHVNDTLLLSAAIFLAWSIRANPIHHDWLFAKIIALIAYIGIATVVIKTKGSETLQWTCYGIAVLIFSYIAAVAMTNSITFGLL
jgi:uncharacterized membrane protein SirB2